MKAIEGLLVVGLAALASGCVKSGTLGPQGFEHQGYGYRVAAGEGGRLLPEQWVVDNFYTPTYRRDAAPDYRRKETPPYRVTYYLDRDGDGFREFVEEDFFYDLRFVHRVHGGVIWLRTFPVSAALTERELHLLMRSYVEDIAGSGVEVVWLAQDEFALGNEKTLASRILSETSGTVAGQEALSCMVEIADVDQLRLDPDHRLRRLRVVLLRTPFGYPAVPARAEDDGSFPVYMVAGYSNFPERFEAGEQDFDGLLAQIEIGGTRGVSFAAPAAADQPEAPPAPEPEPAEAPDVEQPPPPAQPPATEESAPTTDGATSDEGSLDQR